MRYVLENNSCCKRYSSHTCECLVQKEYQMVHCCSTVKIFRRPVQLHTRKNDLTMTFVKEEREQHNHKMYITKTIVWKFGSSKEMELV